MIHLKNLSLIILATNLFANLGYATDCREKINNKNDHAVTTFLKKIQTESEGYITKIQYTDIKHISMNDTDKIEIYYDVNFEDIDLTLKYQIEVAADEKCLVLTSTSPAFPQDFRKF